MLVLDGLLMSWHWEHYGQLVDGRDDFVLGIVARGTRRTANQKHKSVFTYMKQNSVLRVVYLWRILCGPFEHSHVRFYDGRATVSSLLLTATVIHQS